MASVADFAVDHPASLKIAAEPWWTDLYRAAFPNLSGHELVDDAALQRREVDRRLHFPGYAELAEEKYDSHTTGNFFLEYWSVRERWVRGWVARDDLASDWLVYLFTEWSRCYFMPMPLVRQAWREHGPAWCNEYPRRPRPNKGYTTVGCCVPIHVVCKAVDQCFVVAKGEHLWVKLAA